MASPQILQVITDDVRRGAQVFAADLHEALSALGRSVRTVALAPGPHGGAGLEVPVLGRSRLAPRTLEALRHEIRRARVVVGHGSSTLAACALAGIGSGTPFVYRQISDSLFWAPTVGRRVRVRSFLARAQAVVALWRGAASVLALRLGVDKARIHVIPNGVPASRFPVVGARARREARRAFGLILERATVLYIGALVPEKGVDDAVRAIARCDHAQLLVVGAGPERGRLEALAAEQAPGLVHFAGPVGDPAAAFAAADIVVLPSRGGDSMPAVLIEAGLSGLPAVATRVGGIPEIVLDGRTGRVVAPDNPEALASGLRQGLEHAERYGHQARRFCMERFEIGVVASQWEELLSALQR